jgi:hypothetical protein
MGSPRREHFSMLLHYFIQYWWVGLPPSYTTYWILSPMTVSLTLPDRKYAPTAGLWSRSVMKIVSFSDRLLPLDDLTVPDFSNCLIQSSTNHDSSIRIGVERPAIMRLCIRRKNSRGFIWLAPNQLTYWVVRLFICTKTCREVLLSAGSNSMAR